jgi:hypothetical protein
MLPPIFQTLKSAGPVTSLIGNPPRAYRHGIAPQGVTKPYVTWFIIGGVPENTLSELPQIDRLPVQVDCWDTSDAGVEALATAVRDALEPVAHMTSILLDEYEPETKLYRIGMQFDYFLPR